MRPAPGASPVALAPAEWFRATWRPLPPLARPPAPPFDAEESLARLARVSEGLEQWMPRRWERARLRASLSPEEACFWLAAIARLERGEEPAAVARALAAEPGPAPAVQETTAAIRDTRVAWPETAWIPLSVLYPIESVVEGLLAAERAWGSLPSTRWRLNSAIPGWGIGFRDHVLPYLPVDEKAALRERLRPRARRAAWPADVHAAPPLVLLLGASLGLHAELEAVVETWPDGAGRSAAGFHPQAPEILFGLGDPGLVERHARRLGVRPQTPDHARSWLAHTELEALEWILEGILAQRRQGPAAALVRALGLARAPATAPLMLETILRSRAPAEGRAWIMRHPELAAAGLGPALRGRGKAAELARELLEALRQAGHGALVDAALDQLPEASRSRAGAPPPAEGPVLDEESAPGWLRRALEGTAPADRPAWLAAASLPPVMVDGAPFSERLVGRLLAALARSSFNEAHPFVRAVRARADPASLDAFAWRLCELWQQGGHRTRDAWALAAAGMLGGDGCALRLGPLARTWRARLYHRPAAMALECLRAIGTDTALTQLKNFSQLPRDWSLKKTAESYLEEAARLRGLTPEQLEDWIVPDCGLDARGSRSFDYGARRFHLVIGPDLKPMIRWEDGRLRAGLPPPAARDDAALAEAARGEWRMLKQQLAAVLQQQAARLERAMVEGRAWPSEEFEARLIRHPVVGLLLHGLVCATRAGDRTVTFRVAEDQTCAGVEDTPLALPPGAPVWIPHPLRIPGETLGRWAELLSEYRLASPFPQVGRPVYHPLPGERSARELTRFNAIPCMAIALSEGLERRGWQRGPAGDAGCIRSHRRLFTLPDGARVAAVVHYDPGFFVADARGSAVQEIQALVFLPAEQDEGGAARIPLGEVDPVAFSEAAADLAAITSRR